MIGTEPLLGARACTHLWARCDPWATPPWDRSWPPTRVSWASRVACTVVLRTRCWGALAALDEQIAVAVRDGALRQGVPATRALAGALAAGLCPADAVAALAQLHAPASLRV